MCKDLENMSYSIKLQEGQSGTYDNSTMELYGTGARSGMSPQYILSSWQTDMKPQDVRGICCPRRKTYLQVKILHKKSQEWAHKMKRSHLTSHEAYVAYTQVLFPPLVYVTTGIALTESNAIL